MDRSRDANFTCEGSARMVTMASLVEQKPSDSIGDWVAASPLPDTDCPAYEAPATNESSIGERVSFLRVGGLFVIPKS